LCASTDAEAGAYPILKKKRGIDLLA
jgi:hypothetical protein